MKSVLYFLAATVLLAVPATLAKDVNGKATFQDDIDKTFSDGYTQILVANIPASCKQVAFTNLATARAENQNMVCNTTVEIMEDVGSIIYAGFDSLSNFITDMNTVINGIPMCWHKHAWFNFVGIISCMVQEAGDIWRAVVDFFHVSNYYYPAIGETKQLIDCLHKRNHAHNAVKHVLALTKLCK